MWMSASSHTCAITAVITAGGPSTAAVEAAISWPLISAAVRQIKCTCITYYFQLEGDYGLWGVNGQQQSVNGHLCHVIYHVYSWIEIYRAENTRG